MAEFKGYLSDITGELIHTNDRVRVQVILRGADYNHDVSFDASKDEVESWVASSIPEPLELAPRAPRGRAASAAKKAAAKPSRKG